MDPSNETAMGLSENYHSFQLWYGILIAVAGTLVLSCIFISTVITCMQCRRKESVRHVHQIKPMTSKVAYGQAELAMYDVVHVNAWE